MKHASKFQLIETTTYLFLSISLDKVIISVLTKHATCILNKITINDFIIKVGFRSHGCAKWFH